MRLILAGLGLLVSLAPAWAIDTSSPKAVIEGLYEPYLKPFDQVDWSKVDEKSLRTKALTALFDRDAKEANGEIGRLDFDPYINGQDYAVTKLEVADPYFAGGRAVVKVTFDNFDVPQDMGYLLVQEDGGWKIDDMWTESPDFSYSLRGILEAPMP